MAIDATVTDIVQEINDARVDMQSFASFMFEPANVMITRRLAPDTHSLQHYLDYLDAIKLVFTQESGDVTVGDRTIKTVSQLIADGDSSTSAAVADINTRADTAIGNANTSLNNAIDVILRAGGHVGYPTLAAATADKANITAKTIVEITNDTTANNGVYLYDGTNFTKSSYDVVAIAKAYTDAEVLKLANKSSGTFGTLALLTASTLANDSYALVANDPDLTKNGHYKKVSGTWTKVSYDPVAQAKAYTDLVSPIIKTGVTKGNLITNNVIKITDRGLNNNGTLQTGISSARAIVLPVRVGQKLYINRRIDVSGLGGIFRFFANDPIADTSQSPISHSAKIFTDAASGIVYYEVTVPNQSNYLVLSTKYDGAVYTWAVHLNEFIPSFDLGQETVVSINGKGLITGFDLHQLSDLMYSELGHYDRLRESTKNLYNGVVVSGTRVDKLGISPSVNAGDCVTQFIPVTAGQSYTISGLDMSLQHFTGSLILGFTGTTQDTFVKYFDYLDLSGTTTVLIDDPTIKYIVVPITSVGRGTVEQAKAMPLQVELGVEATAYEPYIYSSLTAKMLSGFSPSNDITTPIAATTMISNFVEMNKVRNSEVSTLESVRKDIGSTGLRYIVSGDTAVDSTYNNLFAQTQITRESTRNINVHLLKMVNRVKTLGYLKATPFTVPSGQFDNPDTFSNYSDAYPLYSYVHPSIAYDATGIGGFKYWMMASTLPADNMGDSVWEDEDVFVSNDAKTWQRVRSLYENAKDYTTATLRLPPHNLARANARKHAFLPCPSVGDTIEISVPENNGAPALDRANITLIALPWKHDPFIMFDGVFLYAYVSYHLPYADRTGGKNRFIVCVRTSNGIDWDVVRSDGSTMRLTEASSRTIFTKDAQGRYNYIAYFYNYGGSNPEIIKYGEGDYEFIYGSNFSRRYSGTTPYNFDFSTYLPFKDLGSGNHPTLLLNADTLYLMNNTGLHASTDRGATFTKYDKNPTWMGGVTSYDYKKTMCVGEGGKLIYVDTQRLVTADALEAEGRFTTTNDINLMTTYEYPSVSDFVSKATTGLVDAYIDVQMVITNPETKKRTLKFYPAVSLTAMTGSVNNPMQRITIDSVDFKAGDLVNFYVTLNSRNGAEIQFGGIDIT